MHLRNRIRCLMVGVSLDGAGHFLQDLYADDAADAIAAFLNAAGR